MNTFTPKLSAGFVLFVSACLAIFLQHSVGQESPIPPFSRVQEASDTMSVSFFRAALDGLERAGHMASVAYVDARLMSTISLSDFDVEEASDSLRNQREDVVRSRGRRVGSLLRAEACYGIGGAPPPPEERAEWLRSFPSFCKSDTSVTTVAFTLPQPGRDLCKHGDVTHLEVKDSKLKSRPAQIESRTVQAIRVGKASVTRFDLTMVYDLETETWATRAVALCLSVST